MKCTVPDKEGFRAKVARKVKLFLTDSVSKEQSLDRLDEIAKHIKTIETEDDRYKTYQGVKVTYSPSTLAKDKKGKNIPDTPKAKEARLRGTMLHTVMEKLLKGENAKAFAILNGLSEKHFNSLKGTSEAIKQWATQKQKEIDPTEEYTFRLEHPVLSSSRDIAGIADVLIVFSDGSVSILDYKTMGKSKKSFSVEGYLIDDDPLGYRSREQYDFQFREYKQVLADDYGIKVREVMAVPIILTTDKKGKITNLASYQANDPSQANLNSSFIPTLASSTGNETTDKISDKLINSIYRIEQTLKKKLSPEKRNTLTSRIKLLRGQLADLQVRQSVSLMRTSLAKIDKDLELMNKDGSLDIDVINDMISQVKLYTGVENLYDAFYEHDNTQELSSLGSSATILLGRLEIEAQKLTLEDFDARDKTADGKLKQQASLSYFDRHFTSHNLMDNSFIRAFMNIINSMNDSIRGKVNKAKDHIIATENAALKVTGNTEALYSMLIDREKGELYSKYSEDLVTKFRTISAMDNVESRAIAYKEISEIRDKEAFEKWYQEEKIKTERLTRNELEERGFADKELEDILQYKMDIWRKANYLPKFPEAWSNSYVRRRFTILKPAVAQQYLSEEYKKIEAVPEVLAYYNMWKEQMDSIRNMLGISYRDVKSTFIPWIRRNGWDRVKDDPISAIPEFFSDLTNVREDDVDMFQYLDDSGTLKEVPIHYLRPFKKKDEYGNLVDDVNEKSYDLTKSLLLFTDMAYRAEHQRQIEGRVNAIKDLHSRQADLYVDKAKRNFRGKELVDRLSSVGDMQDVLEKAIDKHVYNIHNDQLFKDAKKDKAFKKILQWNAARTLGLSVITAAAGGYAAKLQLSQIAKSGRWFSKEHMKNAEKLMRDSVADRLSGKRESKAAKFIDAFEVHIETQMEKAINAANPSKLKEHVNERSLYFMYRHADEAVDSVLALSAAQNYYFDNNGNLKKVKGELPEGNKTVYEMFNLKEDGSWSLEGVPESKVQNRIGQFQRAVHQMQKYVKGSMPPGDAAAYQQNLLYQAAMQFKNWMPGVISERAGKIKYEKHTDTVSIGRYVALGQYWDFSREEADWVSNIGQVAKTGIHMVLKMVNRKHLLENTPESKAALEKSFASLPAHVKEYFMENTEDPEVALQRYKDMLESQMVAMATELRLIAGLITGVFMLGFDYGDDDEAIKDYNWATRQTYRFFRKVNLELKFAYNPLEVIELSKHPLPFLSLVSDVLSATSNTIDESRDFLIGEDSPQDKSAPMHYTTRLIKGARQLRQLFDFVWAEDSRLPE